MTTRPSAYTLREPLKPPLKSTSRTVESYLSQFFVGATMMRSVSVSCRSLAMDYSFYLCSNRLAFQDVVNEQPMPSLAVSLVTHYSMPLRPKLLLNSLNSSSPGATICVPSSGTVLL